MLKCRPKKLVSGISQLCRNIPNNLYFTQEIIATYVILRNSDFWDLKSSSIFPAQYSYSALNYKGVNQE